MYNLLQHLKFLLTATNQHGVHSPFIYTYVTKCLYAKSFYSGPQSQTILKQSIAYFRAKRVWLSPDKKSILKEIRHEFPSLQFNNKPYDILFTNPFEAVQFIRNISAEKKIHNNSMLLVDGIHADLARSSNWKSIKKHQEVRVTIDMFYCGAVFFRREQAKEHFKIRI